MAKDLYLCKGDVTQSMIEAASFGRDCDTTASMAGSIAGAMQGASAIRPDWIQTVEEANRDFFQEVEGDWSRRSGEKSGRRRSGWGCWSRCWGREM